MKRKAQLSILLAFSLFLLMIQPSSALFFEDNYSVAPQSDTSNWTVTDLHDFLDTDSYTFNSTEPLDHDESAGSIPYGPAPPSAVYDSNVGLLNWFDPNDPALVPIVAPPYPLGGAPPYLPYPDDPALVIAPDAYVSSPPGYPTSFWNVLDDTQRIHVPEWTALPFSPSPGMISTVLPYSITEVSKQFPKLNFTDPNWNYFGKTYDGVKFSLNVSSSYITDAIFMHANALVGFDPYTITASPTIPPPLDYLELGHVSLINSTNGEVSVNLGLVADLSTGDYWLTDSTFLNMIWGVDFTPGQAFPFINPYAPLPATSGLITDIVAQPFEGTGFTQTGSVSFTYSNSTTQYSLGTDLVQSIDAVTGSVSGSLTVSGNFGFGNFPPGIGATDQIVVLNPGILTDGETLTVNITYKNPAGLAKFEADKWYEFEIEIDWNTPVDWNPTLTLKAYDSDGYMVGAWGIESYFDQWIDFTPDMFYAEFASPVHDGFYMPIISTPQSRLKIDDIKATTEVDLNNIPQYLDYVYGVNGSARWDPVTVSSPPDINRTVNATLSIEYPQDTDPLFTPWLPDYGTPILEFADPFNDTNFLWFMLIPNPLVMQTLDDIDTGVIENVSYAVIILDGKLLNGLPDPVAMMWIGMNSTIPSNFSVEWGTDGRYTAMVGALDITTSNPTNQTFSGETTWANGTLDRVGSVLFNYISDGSYNISMNIHNVSTKWANVPDPPVLAPLVENPDDGFTLVDLDWNDVTGATSYMVYVSIDSGTPTSFPASTSDFTYNVTSDGLYSFWVTASNATGESGISNVRTLDIAITDVGTPSITLTQDLDIPENATNVTVSWASVTDADSYNIYKSSDGITFSLLDSTTSLEYTDVLKVNGTFYYNVTAVEDSIEGGSSNVEFITILLLIPEIPNVTVDPTVSFNGLFHVDWDPTYNTDHYLVYTDTDSTIEIEPGNLLVNITTEGFFQNETNGTYYYVVIAVSSQGFMAESNMVAVTVAIEPPVPRTFWQIILDIIAGFIAFILGLLGLAVAWGRKVRKQQRKCSDGIKCDL